ncbi:MAG TPA: hypothetical protein VM425_11090 [Myxococcota bacterium]|nr:hypothetical protein [Myxococcota bacterium]
MTYLISISVSILAIALQMVSGQTAVIETGREAEIEAMFSGVGAEAATGWRVANIAIEHDHIRAELSGPRNELVILDFVHPGRGHEHVAQTDSFDVVLSKAEGIEPDRAVEIARKIAARVNQKDPGGFWKKFSSQPDIPSPAEPYSPPSLRNRLEEFLSSPVGIAALAWIAGLLGLVALLAIETVRRRPWKNSETKRALIEMGLLVGVALFLRWMLVDAGPANQVIRLPSPFGPPGEYPELGTGLCAWVFGWTSLLGTNDMTLFFAGALAGAVTVVPVYLLGWRVSGSRLAGLVSGLAIAVWPVHAWLSPTDDPAVVISLLSAVAVAAVVTAGRVASAILLVAGWLALVLAAAFRPEPALGWLPLGLMILCDPASRRLQFRPTALCASILVIAAGMAEIYLPVINAMGYQSPLCSLQEFAGLLGLVGSDSILLPPRTPFVLSCLFITGLVLAARASRGRTILWLLVGLLPAVPTAGLASTDLVTARYQLALVPFAAVFAGVGGLWVADHAARLFESQRRWIPAAFGALITLVSLYALCHRPPEPTFRREYKFFRENLAKVPAGCRIVHVGSWDADLGMMIPAHLSRWLGLGHHWIDPAADLDPDSGCLAYWRPASCGAVHADSLLPDGRYYLPSCYLIESTYRLEPIAEKDLPAITGFSDRYTVDPVRVGFYRLRRKINDAATSSNSQSAAKPGRRVPANPHPHPLDPGSSSAVTNSPVKSAVSK